MYHQQLAHIHDIGFGDFAVHAASFVKSLLPINEGTLVDLGCGSGGFLQQFYQTGVKGYGYDISPDMIGMCKSKMLAWDFRVSGLFQSHFPTANGIAAIGEILSYATARMPDYNEHLLAFFQNCFDRLDQDGFFLFDCLVNGEGNFNYSAIHEQDTFTIFMKSSQEKNVAKRQVISFLLEGNAYSRNNETHHLRVFEINELVSILRKIGFSVSLLTSYGDYNLLEGRRAFLCKKNMPE